MLQQPRGVGGVRQDIDRCRRDTSVTGEESRAAIQGASAASCHVRGAASTEGSLGKLQGNSNAKPRGKWMEDMESRYKVWGSEEEFGATHSIRREIGKRSRMKDWESKGGDEASESADREWATRNVDLRFIDLAFS